MHTGFTEGIGKSMHHYVTWARDNSGIVDTELSPSLNNFEGDDVQSTLSRLA